jgi:hypothetical protein
MVNACSLYGFTTALAMVAAFLQPTAAAIEVNWPQPNNIAESAFSTRSKSVSTKVSTNSDLATKDFTIHRYAALGDSYATGVGCGKRISYNFSRYDHAYGYLVNNDLRQTPWKRRKDRKEKTFTFKARIGHTTERLAKRQLRRVKGQVDAVRQRLCFLRYSMKTDMSAVDDNHCRWQRRKIWDNPEQLRLRMAEETSL